jgi:hypothetical protein
MGSNKKKQKTKAVVVLCLVDEDGSEASINDHEELGAKNEDLKELHAENELEQHDNQNVDHDEICVENEGKDEWVRRMLVSNGGRCMLETGNLSTKSKKPKIMQRNKHCSNNFCNKLVM